MGNSIYRLEFGIARLFVSPKINRFADDGDHDDGESSKHGISAEESISMSIGFMPEVPGEYNLYMRPRVWSGP